MGIDWSRYATHFEGLSPTKRSDILERAEELIDRGQPQDDALRRAFAEAAPINRHFVVAGGNDVKVADPDVSLAEPHGPEGESHGGRAGRDPLRYLEDSTPAGTNAFSRAGRPRGSKPQAAATSSGRRRFRSAPVDKSRHRRVHEAE